MIFRKFENLLKSISDDAQTYPKGHPSNLGKDQSISFWVLFLGMPLNSFQFISIRFNSFNSLQFVSNSFNPIPKQGTWGKREPWRPFLQCSALPRG